jgi:hypothetical protein
MNAKRLPLIWPKPASGSAALTEGSEVLGFRGMATARSRVRELEHQVRELDRLNGALDRRFAARW